MATLLASSNSWESETVYKGTDVALLDLTASAGNAPDEIANILRQAGSDVSGIFATEQKKIPERTQVAEMQTATSKAKANSVGRGATGDELEESCDPLEFLTKGYETLTEALGEIWDGIGQFATDLGIAVDTVLGGIVDTANEVLSKAKQYATDLANAISEGLGDVIASLQASPIGQLYNSIVSKASELANNMVSAISNLAQQANAAFEAALNKIEGFVDSISLSRIFNTGCANEAKEESLNQDQLSNEAEVQTALTPPNGSRTVDPKATEAPAPFAERAEEIPKAVEPTPTLQVAINKYREAQLARDATIEEARGIIGSGNRNPAQIADLKKRQGDANYRAGIAKSDLEDAAKFAGFRLGSLPIYGPSYNQPLGPTTYDPEVVARANATVADQEKRYVAAVREFDRANAAQLAEKNKQVYNIFKPITSEDIARHRVLVDVAREKRSAVTAITAEILPGDRAAIFAKIPYDGVIKN